MMRDLSGGSARRAASAMHSAAYSRYSSAVVDKRSPPPELSSKIHLQLISSALQGHKIVPERSSSNASFLWEHHWRLMFRRLRNTLNTPRIVCASRNP